MLGSARRGVSPSLSRTNGLSKALLATSIYTNLFSV